MRRSKQPRDALHPVGRAHTDPGSQRATNGGAFGNANVVDPSGVPAGRSGSRAHGAEAAPRHHGPGLIQVLLVACLVCGALVFGAGELASHHMDVEQSRELARAQVLLEQSRRAIVAWPEEDLRHLDGTSVGGRSDPRASGYRVEYRVREAGGMLKVDAVLLDRSTRSEMGRMVAWRGRG